MIDSAYDSASQIGSNESDWDSISLSQFSDDDTEVEDEGKIFAILDDFYGRRKPIFLFQACGVSMKAFSQILKKSVPSSGPK